MDVPLNDPDELPYDDLPAPPSEDSEEETTDESSESNDGFSNATLEEGVEEPIEELIGQIEGTSIEDLHDEAGPSLSPSREQLLAERQALFASRHECDGEPCTSSQHGMGALINQMIGVANFVGNIKFKKLLDLV